MRLELWHCPSGIAQCMPMLSQTETRSIAYTSIMKNCFQSTRMSPAVVLVLPGVLVVPVVLVVLVALVVPVVLVKPTNS